MQNAPDAEDHGVFRRRCGEMLLHRVIRQIPNVLLVIGRVSYAMVAETSLPYWKLVKELFTKRVSGAAFDELNRTLQSDGFGRRQQCMKVIGHHDETVEAVASLIAIAQQRFDKNLAGWSSLEDGAALPRARGHEICAGYIRVALRNSHSLSG